MSISRKEIILENMNEALFIKINFVRRMTNKNKISIEHGLRVCSTNLILKLIFN